MEVTESGPDCDLNSATHSPVSAAGGSGSTALGSGCVGHSDSFVEVGQEVADSS